MKELVFHKLEELYTVRMQKLDPNEMAEMENLSRTYGTLLHSSRARTGSVQGQAVAKICEEVTQYNFFLLKLFFITCRLRTHLKPLIQFLQR